MSICIFDNFYTDYFITFGGTEFVSANFYRSQINLQSHCVFFWQQAPAKRLDPG